MKRHVSKEKSIELKGGEAAIVFRNDAIEVHIPPTDDDQSNPASPAALIASALSIRVVHEKGFVGDSVKMLFDDPRVQEKIKEIQDRRQANKK